MYCENCGKQNADDAKFCAHCGKETGTVVSGSPAGVVPVQKPAGNKKLLMTLLIAGGGVLVAAAVILTLVFTVWASPLTGTWHLAAMKSHKAGDGFDFKITAQTFEPDTVIDATLTGVVSLKKNKYTYTTKGSALVLKKAGSTKTVTLGYILKGDTLTLLTAKGKTLTFVRK